MSEMLNITQASQYLNVSDDTLRLWDKNGKLKPLKTVGGHRRYRKEDLDKFLGLSEEIIEDIIDSTVTYASVSSNDQKQK